MKNVRQKSHCILQKHCWTTLIQYYRYLLAILLTIGIIAFVSGNDVFPGIHIKQEDDATDNDSIVVVEELSTSVSYTMMEVKSKAGK